MAGVYRILSATVSATFLLTSVSADGARTSMGSDTRWYACESAAHWKANPVCFARIGAVRSMSHHRAPNSVTGWLPAQPIWE